MDLSVTLGAMALIVSIMALAVSSLLTARQVRLLKYANHIPAVIELLTEFRSVDLHDRYMQVVTGLPPATPSTGLSDLPHDIRAAVLDVAYYFQTFAALIGLGILDERRTLAMLRIRFVNVWDAIESFVIAERTKNQYTGPQLLRILEYYANKARELPDDQVRGMLGKRVKQDPSRLKTRTSQQTGAEQRASPES